MNNTDDGKTVAPNDNASGQAMECPGDGSFDKDGKPIRYRHAWSWVWADHPTDKTLRVWTDRMRCDNCRQEKQSSRGEGDVEVTRVLL